MNAEASLSAPERPVWWRRISLALRRSPIIPILEGVSALAALAMAGLSYLIITDEGLPRSPLTPPTVAMLLVANLVPAMALMVFAARRIAMRRAAASPVAGRGRLHVRLVAVFSVIASVPTLLVVIFASLLFQSGTQFWFSDRARTVLASAEKVSQIYEAAHKQRLQLDVKTMGGDMVDSINHNGLDSKAFENQFLFQTLARQFTESAILSLNSKNQIQTQIGVNLYDRPIEKRFSPAELHAMREGEVRVVRKVPDRVEAVIRLDRVAPIFLYGARKVSTQATGSMAEARSAASEYKAILERARMLQFRFNAALFLVSLLIVGLAIWAALAIADRLVRPVAQLVDAARRVAAGDLSVRVPSSRMHDEVSTLGNAFNRMTRRLEEQTGALVSANSQLDSRRAFIEAVLSGVTAGVISVDRDRQVRLLNTSAEALLKTNSREAIGKKLADLAPELDRQLDSDEREDIIQFTSGGEARTLAVKRVKVEGGHVVTFDDITQQIIDQRRAAWSDVARRIAHEIKNPLTPIQLAAERLQRRYGKEIQSDPGTFERLTGTIVRQVGDLRRMVDEFSSFARTPKPVFREEKIVEIARQALFLHEVAHPDIAFTLEAPEPSPLLVCDRRQLGQALTNVVKNGIEAIQHKKEVGGEGPQRIAIIITEPRGSLCIDVTDTGAGLPPDRDRLTEPYMTTRPKGTGLGLAIVKKIVEEHYGSIAFEDDPAVGTRVRIVLDKELLAKVEQSDDAVSEDEEVNN